MNKCRDRYQRRKSFRHKVESTTISEATDGRVYLSVCLGEHNITGLLDSGASVSCLGRDSGPLLEKLGIPIASYPSSVSTADRKKQEILGRISFFLKYNNEIKIMDLLVIPSLNPKLYLGIDFCKAFSLLSGRISEIHKVDSEATIPTHTLSSSEKLKLNQVISMFPDSELLGLGKIPLLKHHIDMEGNPPFKARYYDYSPYKQKLIDVEIARMLSMKVIEPSQSAYCSPVMLKIKPNK